jgi:hypothetical protein
MENKNKGGPAFPVSCPIGNSGMTLRDWFAGQALAGYCVSDLPFQPEGAAEWSYNMADAMLKERDK